MGIGNWSVADWLTYAPFIIAAVVMAVVQGSKDIPENPSSRVARFIRQPRWNYAPIILIVISCLFFMLRQFGVIGEREPEGPKIKTVYVDKWHTKAVYVPTSDPTQAAKIQSLLQELSTANAEIYRLKHPRRHLVSGGMAQQPVSGGLPPSQQQQKEQPASPVTVQSIGQKGGVTANHVDTVNQGAGQPHEK